SYRQQMGHAWLGFSEEQTTGSLGEAGFGSIRIVPLPPDAKSKGPALFVATAKRQELIFVMKSKEHIGEAHGNSPRHTSSVRGGKSGRTRAVQGEGSLAGGIRPQGDPIGRAGNAGADGAA